MPRFDNHSESYDADVRKALGFVRQDPAFFAFAKAESLVEVAREELGPTRELTALDVGCGPGTAHGLLAESFRSLQGVDVSKAMIDRASREHPNVTYLIFDGKVMPFSTASFDLTFAMCVVHHVPQAQWPDFVRELRRVTRPGGLVAIYEHNPANPFTRLIVSRCVFDDDAVLVPHRTARTLLLDAGMALGPSGYLFFFPWQGDVTQKVERRLSWLKLGAQYFITGRVL
jgi:SAM-dependent methyltransferase